jgi:serine/threonine protein kinase
MPQPDSSARSNTRQGSHRSGLAHPIMELVRARFDATRVSAREFAKVSGVSPATVSRILKGEPVFENSAREFAIALGCKLDFLFRIERKDSFDPERLFSPPRTEEWDVDEIQTDWVTATNGLQFLICRLKHRHEEGRYARGKFYNLLGVRGEERQHREHLLRRHWTISHQVLVHPNIAVALSLVPTLDGNGWWVIDRWVDGESLDDRLDRGSLGEPELRSLASHMLNGLAALHKVAVVFRELAPSRVIVTPDGSAVLTDFELAKLFDGSPSVKPGDWPDDPYRAPEVESERFDHRADLFSWGRILARCVLGELPAIGEDAKRLASSSLPKGVRETVRVCLAIKPDDRPESVHKILPTIARWK